MKADGLCALLRHQWEPHPDKEGFEWCRYCLRERKVGDERVDG